MHNLVTSVFLLIASFLLYDNSINLNIAFFFGGWAIGSAISNVAKIMREE